ncbi:MAG: cupin [Flavipsychrobacter sp.]|jgi:quercetin dioxygenase-like cupin family protein|nr:cupin [Flavipsychrobacter sp.]
MQTTNSIAAVVAAAEGKKLNVMGHSVTVKLSRKETEGNHYVFEVVTPPGHGIPPHVHDREDELIYVVEGEYAVMLGDKQFVAKQGDEIYFPKYIPHAFQNIGNKAGKTLWTVIPGGSFEEFFEELAALPVGEPNLQVVAAIFAKYGMEVLVNAPA